MIKFHIMDIPLFRQWLKEKRNLSDSSIYVYSIAVGAFLKKNPDLENLQDYNDFLVEATIKKRTTYAYHALKLFVDFKMVDAATKNRLKDGFVKPRLHSSLLRERRHLNEIQIFEVINLLQLKHRIISIIQHLTGVRAGDIMRITRGNIKTEEYNGKLTLKLIVTGKGDKRNVVYVHDEVAQNLIMDYITSTYNHDDYYFLEQLEKNSKNLSYHNDYNLYKNNYWRFWVDLKEAIQSCGISKEEFATHDFRRCFARRAWKKYKDIHVLQSLLNHRDATVTLRYLEQSGLKNIDYHHEMQM